MQVIIINDIQTFDLINCTGTTLVKLSATCTRYLISTVKTVPNLTNQLPTLIRQYYS